MAKDPAFLFFPNDWTGGTGLLTRHLKGCYIDLLIAQFNHGHLSLENIRTVLGTDFSSWNTLQKKFAQDATGNFFNERLETEMTKRAEFTKKQRENGSKGGRPKNPPNNPTETQTLTNKEGGNRIGIGNSDFGKSENLLPPSQAMIEDAFTENGLTREQGEEFFKEVEGRAGWEKINNWKIYTESAIVKRINQKNGKQTGNSNRFNEQKRGIEQLEHLANEILRQPTSGNS